MKVAGALLEFRGSSSPWSNGEEVQAEQDEKRSPWLVAPSPQQGS